MKSAMELKCPRCEANLSISKNKDILYCQYCGAKIILTDENTFTINKTVHTIDEANITRAETERMSRIHQMELDREKSKKNARMNTVKTICSVFLGMMAISVYYHSLLFSILCIVGIVLMWYGKDIFSKK